MQENPKPDSLAQNEAQSQDTQQQQIDNRRKQVVGNSVAIGLCVGMAVGLIFIIRFGLVAVIIGALVGGVVGVRAGLEIFKKRK
ncbi:MAG: hypothetical protein ACK5L0_01135 [Candidatus Fimivivens sp.]